MPGAFLNKRRRSACGLDDDAMLRALGSDPELTVLSVASSWASHTSLFRFVIPSREAVDEVMGKAVAAGGGVVKEAATTPWGYFGYFSDPDGYLWKVASAS